MVGGGTGGAVFVVCEHGGHVGLVLWVEGGEVFGLEELTGGEEGDCGFELDLCVCVEVCVVRDEVAEDGDGL